jgi:transcriptional regulator with XRE-family HTH domain
VADTLITRAARERHSEMLHQVSKDLKQARLAAGVSQHDLATAARIAQSYVSKVEAGAGMPRLEVLVAMATALGMEPSLKLFPATGPRIRDRVSAPITDALLAVAHQRWGRRLEVAVTRPDRGVIDLVLTDARTGDIVATEVQGQLRRVEEQLRWAGQKADSLPSAVGWPWGVHRPRVSRLLVLRSTTETRALVRGLPDLFRSAYPVSEEAAWRALTSARDPWPGNAMLWAEATGGRARILEGAPRASGR